jgi:hypothetical protein
MRRGLVTRALRHIKEGGVCAAEYSTPRLGHKALMKSRPVYWSALPDLFRKPSKLSHLDRPCAAKRPPSQTIRYSTIEEISCGWNYLPFLSGTFQAETVCHEVGITVVIFDATTCEWRLFPRDAVGPEWRAW